MTVRRDDANNVHSIEVEVEVPGTPEQVWQAIATGPGFSAWFVPTEIEERVGGAIRFNMGPGMDNPGIVTAWEPPRHFAAEEKQEWMGPGAPPCATDIFVEAKAGGVCRVRLVSSLFTSKTDWDDQLESLEKGWPAFLEILRLYLTHFPGQRCAPLQAMGTSSLSEADAYARLMAGLGISAAAPAAGGRLATSGAGAPRLSGVVEGVVGHCLTLRTEQPAAGLAVLSASDCGAHGVIVQLNAYFYGDGAGPVAEREQPSWQAWFGEHFPASAPVDPAAEAVR